MLKNNYNTITSLRIDKTKQNNRRENYHTNSRPIVHKVRLENNVDLQLNEIEIHSRKTK